MRKLFGSISVYAGSNIVNAAIPFVLLPILTRNMSPEDYGIVAMFQVLTGLVSPFIGLSIHGAIARQYYERDRIDMPVYVSSAMLILLVSSILVGLILLLAGDYIAHLAGYPSEYLWAVWAVAVAQFIVTVVLTRWQVLIRPLSYGTFQISRTFLDALLSIFFVVALQQGWTGRVDAQVIAYALFAIMGLTILIKSGWLKPKASYEYIRHAVNFGLPLIPHTLGFWAIQMTDRVILVQAVGLTQTGIYFASIQLGRVVLIIQDSFNKAWVPYFYSKLRTGNTADRVSILRFSVAYSVTLILFAILFGLLVPLIVPFFLGPEFADSGRYVLWIALGYAFNGIYKLASNYMFYAEKTRVLAWLTFCTAALNVLATYILVQLNGTIGAAQGLALAFLISMILTTIVAARIHPMPWRQAFVRKSK